MEDSFVTKNYDEKNLKKCNASTFSLNPDFW